VEASEEVLAEGVQAATVDLTRVEEPARATRRRSAAAGGLAALGVAAAAFLIIQFGFAQGGDNTPTSPAGSPTRPPSLTPTPSTGSALLDRIRATGKLRVAYRDGLPGVSLGHPPRGFEIEVAEHIARALKVPEGGVRFVPVGYAAREAAVEEGKVDLVIANFSIDDADPGRVTFAGPYYVAHRDVLVRAGAKISTLRDLRGKTICVTSGLTTAAMIRDRGVDFVAVQDDDISKCASQVADGRSDALAGDDIVVAGFGARLRAAKLKIAGIRLTSERYGVALKRGDSVACRAINDVIGSMYADGTMKQLLQHHLGRVDFRFETELPRLEGC
jgi:ABC-type amino acid transport substrate-binding protein